MGEAKESVRTQRTEMRISWILEVQPTQAQSGLTPVFRESTLHGELWQEQLQMVVTHVKSTRNHLVPSGLQWMLRQQMNCRATGPTARVEGVEHRELRDQGLH